MCSNQLLRDSFMKQTHNLLKLKYITVLYLVLVKMDHGWAAPGRLAIVMD
jgi:hypothetical protein